MIRFNVESVAIGIDADPLQTELGQGQGVGVALFDIVGQRVNHRVDGEAAGLLADRGGGDVAPIVQDEFFRDDVDDVGFPGLARGLLVDHADDVSNVDLVNHIVRFDGLGGVGNRMDPEIDGGKQEAHFVDGEHQFRVVIADFVERFENFDEAFLIDDLAILDQAENRFFLRIKDDGLSVFFITDEQPDAGASDFNAC